MRKTTLIVEHDPAIRHVLGAMLYAAGIDTIFAASGAQTRQQMHRRPDAIIMDPALPDADGLELLRELRAQSETPILIHSGCPDEMFRIINLESGADDFLHKPCNLRELLARTRRLLRCAQQNRGIQTLTGTNRVNFGRWTLDLALRELISTDGTKISLGGSVFALLNAFVNQPFVGLSRQILSEALKHSFDPHSRLVDAHVSHLRRILGTQSDGAPYIKTLRSQGYLFLAKVSQSKD